ncbi:AMP-binding protein [Allonocardiopsis opalescens]|uniref:Amino acid adenylation domain-containing protein n=1 Tax=Allonocardiopsis opalescens TaxID=1144618 RepID=A0A2T0QCS5_9ACTN|nr:AMP-binding protein [Allonocardiopsis opalescens]PRY01754.1 amino acid adenylation domain-containing protein [Allonocardiopsis opalescens]
MNEMNGPALHARFLRGLSAAPDRPAFYLGARSATYREVHERALLWAGALRRAAGGTPAPVGVLAGKGETAYTGILAGLYAGAVVVPLHPMFPAARTRQMLKAAGVGALITDERGGAALPELLGADHGLPVLAPAEAPGAAGAGTVAARPEDALDRPCPAGTDDTAYVLFTSGSTGRPKGVPITHGSTHHYFRLLDARYDFSSRDVFSQTFDLNFDCAMFDLFCAWGAGASVVAVPPSAYRDLPAFCAERGLTVWFATPSAIGLTRRMGGLAPGSLPSLRWSFFAGEALRCRDAEDWQRAAAGSVVENLYGPTELTVTVTAHRWDPDASRKLGVNGVVPIGTLHDGHEELLIGADGEPAETEGELCVAGPQLTPGYLDPEDGAGRFLDRDGRRWYRTGDRVRRVGGGELAYLGRLDAQVQVQGWRVELGEIDHALAGCPGVESAVTVSAAREDGVELVVFYTGRPATPAELARSLRELLPHGMIPRRYQHLDELPLNANRKVDRPVLAARAAELVGAAAPTRGGAAG